VGPGGMCDDDRPGVAVQTVQVEWAKAAVPSWLVSSAQFNLGEDADW
jgi:hypothetical protein